MVCICSFVCSERERVVRHKHRDRQIDRQRFFLVKWSSASKTQNSCRLCIKHLHFCFFPSMLCNSWSLYLMATYDLHLNTHLVKLGASSNCVFAVGKKRQDRLRFDKEEGWESFQNQNLYSQDPPTPWGQGSPFLDFGCGSDKLVFSFSLLQCWCFFSSPSLSAVICLTVFSQSSTHDDLYSFSLWICKSLYMHKKLWPCKSII